MYKRHEIVRQQIQTKEIALGCYLTDKLHSLILFPNLSRCNMESIQSELAERALIVCCVWYILIHTNTRLVEINCCHRGDVGHNEDDRTHAQS